MRKRRELEWIRPAANSFLFPSPRPSVPTLLPAMRRPGREKPLKWVEISHAGAMRPSGEPPSMPAVQLSPSGAY